MIFVFTGNGKGKTTTALGQGLRALGQGKNVICLQFIKSKSYETGEDKALRAFGKNFKLVKGGKGFVGILGDKLPFREHKKAAVKTLTLAAIAVRAKKWYMIILDEINVALRLKLIPLAAVLKILKNAPADKIVILTGRHAPEVILKMADLATYCVEVAHPFKVGVKAAKGIEY